MSREPQPATERERLFGRSPFERIGIPLFFVLLAIGFTWYAYANLPKKLVGDEWRYLWYAENLTRGYFSPPDYVFLWSGPGYPLCLAPLVALDVPLHVLRGLNGVLLAASHFVFFCFARQFTNPRAALLWTLPFVVYPPSLTYLPLVYTETLTLLLVSAFLLGLTVTLRHGGWWRPLSTGLVFGALVMVKVGFWPMLFGGFAVFGLLYAVKRQTAHRRITATLGVAIVSCIPFLAYTYEVTGRPFYWGSGSGSLMYWITNPHDGTYGEWLNQVRVEKIPALRKHHWALYQELGRFDENLGRGHQGNERIARHLAPISSPEADDVFMAIAKQNLREHPERYVRNVGYNMVRLVFDFPYVVRKVDREMLRLAFANPFVLVAIAAGLVRLVRRKAQEPALASFLAWFILSYLGAMSLVSAQGRFFVPVAPLGIALLMCGYAGPFARWLARRSGRTAAA